jgi:hypothetical protein
MEKNMRNYRKRLSTSGISIIAAQMAATVLNLFNVGQLADRPMPMIDPLIGYKLPKAWQLPGNKHGCNKRGGRSKRRRNLNYWRRA